MAELEPGDIVLCTVDRIERTVVFVKIFFEGREIEGSIVTSEIAPGRIRNLRDYVVPKKKIVCKVLRVSHGNIELSLRRVSPKERKEVMDEYNQEKSYISILKSILKEKTDEAIKKISQEGSLFDFIEESKENPEKLEKIVGKSNAEKIMGILLAQKPKKAFLKKRMSLKTTSSNGIQSIKEILGGIKEAEIKYISAGVYSIKTEAENIKKADQKMQEILKEIEKKAGKEGADFAIS